MSKFATDLNSLNNKRGKSYVKMFYLWVTLFSTKIQQIVLFINLFIYIYVAWLNTFFKTKWKHASKLEMNRI